MYVYVRFFFAKKQAELPLKFQYPEKMYCMAASC